MWRYKKAVPVDYNRQGYIYFASLGYKKWATEEEQERIEKLCKQAGGPYWRALLAFVTDERATAASVCQRYYIGQMTLYRIVRKYYVDFAQKLAQR